MLQVGGIGNWDWAAAAAAGRAQLVAGSFELQKEPFFLILFATHSIFCFVYGMNCHFVVVLLPNQC